MKLSPRFLTHETKGEYYMVSASGSQFSGIVKNNKTAAFIIECLKSDTTEDEITDKILDKYAGAERDTVRKDVSNVIAKLRSIGAVEY